MAALRLSQGYIFEAENILSKFGLDENPSLTFSLGLLASGDQGTIPSYPLGFPALLVPVLWLFGEPGVYWVVPILGAATVLMTYLLGRCLLNRWGGAIAALFVLFYPSNMFLMTLVMSDVPATFLSVFAFYILLCSRRNIMSSLLLGGILGLGVWVRPNMVLLVPTFLLWLVIRREYERFVWVGLSGGVFAVLLGWYNWHWFGAPWKTGYTSVGLQTDLSEMLGHALQHFMNINAQQMGIGGLLLACGLVKNRIPAKIRVLFGVNILLFLAFFSSYSEGQTLWSYRFFLPVLPLIGLIQAGFIVWLLDRTPYLKRSSLVLKKHNLPRTLVLVFLAALFADQVVSQAAKLGTFSEYARTHRYKWVAQRAEIVLQPATIVLAMQHSSALRVYSGLSTLRYDRNPEELFPVLRKIFEQGGRVVFVIDFWEHALLDKSWSVFNDNEVPLSKNLVPIEVNEQLRVGIYELERSKLK